MTTHEVRKRLGFTQKDFAQYLNVDVRTVQNWDSRSTMPEYILVLINKIQAEEMHSMIIEKQKEEALEKLEKIRTAFYQITETLLPVD